MFDAVQLSCKLRGIDANCESSAISDVVEVALAIFDAIDDNVAAVAKISGLETQSNSVCEAVEYLQSSLLTSVNSVGRLGNSVGEIARQVRRITEITIKSANLIELLTAENARLSADLAALRTDVASLRADYDLHDRRYH